jgi:hypothetical protein
MNAGRPRFVLLCQPRDKGKRGMHEVPCGEGAQQFDRLDLRR